MKTLANQGCGIIPRSKYKQENQNREEKLQRKIENKEKKLLHVRVQDVYYNNTKADFSWNLLDSEH
jgi:hypothetical protein